MSDPRIHNKPTLEELLRVKRAERPDVEFWLGFERELRQKQLTALVEKRRWWHGVPLLTSRRVYLPVGATALVAFALVAVRFNSAAGYVAADGIALPVAVADSVVEMLPATVVASHEILPEETLAAAEHAAPVMREEAVSRVAAMPARDEISPSARSIAANYERLEQAEPELVHAVIGNRLSSAARLQSAVATVESDPVMIQEPAPRYRLIARYADRMLSPKPAAPDIVRQHLARRLGDDLADDMSRIGVVGDRVSLKF